MKLLTVLPLLLFTGLATAAAPTRLKFETISGYFVSAPDAFKSQLVLSAIRRGMAFCTYQVTSVTENDGVVQLRYKTTAKKSESASFSCPLIISIPQGKYQAIEFHENNKLVKRLAIKKQ